MKFPESVLQIANDIKTMKIRGAGKIARIKQLKAMKKAAS